MSVGSQLGRWVAAAAAACMLAAPAPAAADPSCPLQNEPITAVNRDQLEVSMLCLTNAHRADAGLPALALDTRLAGAARGHAEDMVSRDYFDHVSPEGADSDDRAAAFGYPGGVGENIAYTSERTIRALFNAWRNSTGHNENMLDPGYLAAGIGLAVGRPGGSGITGVQMFGTAPANGSQDPDSEGDEESGASSVRCMEARRALRAKRRAYRKAPWVSSASTIKRLRSKMRAAKRRADAACA